MRRMQGAIPAEPALRTRRAPRVRGMLSGGVIAVTLTILFWLIFYQDLPGNFGLNGTPSEGAASLAHDFNRFLKFGMILVSLRNLLKSGARLSAPSDGVPFSPKLPGRS